MAQTETTAAEQSQQTTSSATSALPRRFLRPLLWLGLSHAERSYGYELAEAVRSFGLNIDLGGVYRELRSMEQHDLLISEWEPSENGPDRRIYLKTDAGQLECQQAIHGLRQARDQLSAALRSVDDPTNVDQP